jgi:hypothetical protein
MKKGYIFLVLAILIVVGLFFVPGKITGNAINDNIVSGQELTLYKSSSCGCCGVYGNYFQRKGNSDLEIINMENLEGVKGKYNIPSELQSCHTTVIGDYYVEGHIPLEAIDKLLKEKPDIAGIAMPGMPEGSPGMPGVKRGDFIIYAVNHDGSYEEFMRI